MKFLLILVVAIGVVLLAQFPMETLADESQLAHWTQHGLLFWGGVGTGIAGFGLYQAGQRRP